MAMKIPAPPPSAPLSVAWFDRHGIHVFAAAAIVIAVGLAVANGIIFSKNKEEIGQLRELMKSSSVEGQGDVVRMKGEVDKHERDILRIFGILGKPRELRRD